MHPALSVIFFTTLSGAGYGLLFCLGLLQAFGPARSDSLFGLAGLALAGVLIVAGLVASTVHLGHPERAWRALSQWRSSWLSREGALAIAGFAPLALIIGDLTGTVSLGPAVTAVWIAAALLAVATVYSTGMIYASLKSIRQWHHALVVPLYLAFALMSGAYLLTVLLAWFGRDTAIAAIAAAVTLAATWAMKWHYWRDIGSARSVSDVNTATGLAGRVRVFDPPHTEDNYLLREMGFQIARRHRDRLRRIASVLGAALPLGLLLAQILTGGVAAALLVALGGLALLAGVAVERWLFFAEAEHTVTLYYRGSTEPRA